MGIGVACCAEMMRVFLKDVSGRYPAAIERLISVPSGWEVIGRVPRSCAHPIRYGQALAEQPGGHPRSQQNQRSGSCS